MIRCTKCDNDTRTSALVTSQGDVMLAGTLGTDPQPIVAQVCTACGYIELYAPIPLDQPERSQHEEQAIRAPEGVTATA
ncbi:MAG: hypothetical protein IPO81_13125 [Kouleothrix sp.]|nr:hypothetical protein [Kouleothrix sp.]